MSPEFRWVELDSIAQPPRIAQKVQDAHADADRFDPGFDMPRNGLPALARAMLILMRLTP
jgi:hypothetical protein